MKLTSTLARTLVLVIGIAGCNSILDNKPGRLQQEATPTVEQTTPDDGSTTPPPATTTPPVNTNPPVSQPTTPGPEGCKTGTHLCGGACAAMNDPNYGCGAEGCASCKIAHGTAACAGTSCVVGTCAKGYADCNGKPEDGCETDLSKPSSCGSCNAKCPATAEFCVPQGDSFQCGTNCSPAAPIRCGNECVATLTTVNHCGACGIACTAPTNGTAACTAAACTYTCNAGFHDCGGACVPDDVNACGAACTACPARANATATCTTGACGATCLAGFADCNAVADDGCEVNTKTDVAHCGGCNMPCTGTCAEGVCTPPPDDAGAPPPP